MDPRSTTTSLAQCLCGTVKMDLLGPPIMTVACYCQSCQEAAHRIQELPGAPKMLDSDGGTHFVLQRKDRFRCYGGIERLREYRLAPDAASRRVVATCCNTPMFLEFAGGHWLSIYKDRLEAAHRPPLEMRTMTEGRRSGEAFSDGIPSPGKHSIHFMWKLFSAWVGMGFTAPTIDYVIGTINDQDCQ